MNQVHATTGIGITLAVIGGAGFAIATAAIVFDRYLDRRTKRAREEPLREELPRAQAQPPNIRRW